MKTSFIEELSWRGLIHDMTPGLEEKLRKGVVTGYIGFDPTAPSLTLGNYIQIMLLKFFQLAGHKPVVLFGGATGRIGDPSGKDTERELKTYEEIDRNLSFQIEQVRKLLDFSAAENGAILVNNLDFYRKMNALDFLRDVGKNFTINYMMSKESVKRRVETGMSYTEFSYQLLQSYDFLRLAKDYNCILQMGGSDQWGNITSGIEYIRRNTDDLEVHGLTSPLLTRADGKKFGKSEEGNIWLDPEMTSPYKFYQFWLNVDDRDLAKLFRYFSLLSKKEIEAIESEHASDPRLQKAILGEELTKRIHGEKAFATVKQVTDILFNPKSGEEQLSNLSEKDFDLIIQEIPSYRWESGINETAGMNLIDVLTQSGIFASKGEARKAIDNNAVSVNKKKINDIAATISTKGLLHEKYLFIENGKKNKYIIAFGPDLRS